MTAHCFSRKPPNRLEKARSASLTNLAPHLRMKGPRHCALHTPHQKTCQRTSLPSSVIRNHRHFIFTIHLQPTVPSLVVQDLPTLFRRRPLSFFRVNSPQVQPELRSRLLCFCGSYVFGFFHYPQRTFASCLSLPGANPCTDITWPPILTLRFLGKWPGRKRANPRRQAETTIFCLRCR